jgi:hypothetical protein
VAKPFDATTKHLIETNPQDWLEYVGMPRTEVQIISRILDVETWDELLGP